MSIISDGTMTIDELVYKVTAHFELSRYPEETASGRSLQVMHKN
ncbi:hypothetical protein ACQRBN_08125 [Bariatricus sp. SGI.154]